MTTMAELALVFFTSFLVGLTGAISPGPLLVLNIREAARVGFWAGPSVASGHSLLELVMVVVLAQGLRQILNTPTIVGSIGILGGLVLLWMGAMIMVEGRKARLPIRMDPHSETPRPRLVGVLAGALVSIANPYWWVWWLTVGVGYLVLSMTMGLPGIVSFYGGHILADYFWYSLVALGIAGGRRIIGDRFYQWLSVSCGGVILLVGIFFLIAGFRAFAN